MNSSVRSRPADWDPAFWWTAPQSSSSSCDDSETPVWPASSVALEARAFTAAGGKTSYAGRARSNSFPPQAGLSLPIVVGRWRFAGLRGIASSVRGRLHSSPIHGPNLATNTRRTAHVLLDRTATGTAPASGGSECAAPAGCPTGCSVARTLATDSTVRDSLVTRPAARWGWRPCWHPPEATRQ